MTRAPVATLEDVNGLRHHVLTWDGGGETTVLCLHGWLDHARTFTATVDALHALDPTLHCVAFDWRGHGETAWAPAGSYYHFADYVRDVVVLARRHGRRRLVILAHSMGAMVASLWLGARPDDAVGLVMLEGLGPPVTKPTGYVARMRQWLDETAPFDPARFEKPMRDLAHACARMARAEPRLTSTQVLQLASWASIERPDGTRVWRYDPLHRTRSPVPIPTDAGAAFWAALRGPVLWLGGAESAWVRPEVLARLDALPHCQRQLIQGAGHGLHNDQPEAVARAVQQFIESLPTPPPGSPTQTESP
ncbi:MAG: pimeloyl-ACP methyl ester carboxylesterase [Bradymonadia bacterium]|jgi:pimeloyl-ACP methyl ester carboxylesterase